MSANYHYVLDQAVRLSCLARPKILDYGCGAGPVVKLGLERGLDIDGVDTYYGTHEKYHNHVNTAQPQDVQGRIHKIEIGKIPFADAVFDVVISNQVFEHVSDPWPCVQEIHRVLKPGGAFLALFPVRETAWEGHVRLWFAHWLKKWPTGQLAYLRLVRRLGFGVDSREFSGAGWAEKAQAYLRDYTYYYPYSQIRKWWVDAFGSPPEGLEFEYMLYRLPFLKRFAGIPGMKWLLEMACVTRGGLVIVVRKPKKERQQEQGTT